MYTTNNLYYIISNGGIELNINQMEAILNIRRKVVGDDKTSRIENENTATLTREEIHSLVTEIDDHISRHQLKIIANKQEYVYKELL